MTSILKSIVPSTLLLALCFAIATSAGAQTAPGYVVSIYASGVTRPASLSFAPSGDLYVGNGLNTGPVKISRIGAGGSPVVEFGASGINDPDSVLFDVVGAVSGTAGSVLVGGGVGSIGRISAIRPDESIVTLFGPSLPLINPSDMKFTDPTGSAVVISDFGGVGSGGLFSLLPGGVVSSLVPIVNPNEIEIDADGLIYVSGSTGTISVFNPNGSVSNATLATGLGTSQVLALAPGNAFGSDLYAINYVSGELLRITTDGLSAPVVVGTGFTFAGGMEFGPDGALYVSMNSINQILRIAPDVDGDGLDDADDPCINSGARDITVKPKLLLKKIGTDPATGNDGLKMKGGFVSATAFASLDPLTNGVRVLLLNGIDNVLTDIVIPSGTGWSVSDAKLSFADSTGANGGITKLQVQDRSNSAPNQVSVQIAGKYGTYPVGIGDEPLRMIVVIGDGAIGECGETAFAPGGCVFNAAGNAVKCQ